MCNVSKNKFVEITLKKCGFLELAPKIVKDIEGELAERYNAAAEEDDASYPATYGGVIYHSEPLITEGAFSFRLKNGLSDNQKEDLKNLINYDDFEVSVERTDYKQKWTFRIQPEISKS